MAENERERVSTDAAGVGPYARDEGTLARLSELSDWEVREGEPDIRGWEVRTVSGRVLGTIADLLVDPDAHEVVMLDVDIAGTGRHALVPIRVAEVDRVRRVLRMDSAELRDEHRPVDDVPVPPAITPAEVDARAEAVEAVEKPEDRL